MNLEQKLLVCETMLTRLDAAMASAEAEAMRSSALEGHLRGLLDNLTAEQARLDQNMRAIGADPGHRHAGKNDEDSRVQSLQEQMTRIKTVQGRLLLLLNSPDGASAQHP